jgi:triosephosphate isomerase
MIRGVETVERKLLIAGNWKMNTDLEEAAALVDGIVKRVGTELRVDAVVCPPYPFIEIAVKLTTVYPVLVGAQNVHYEEGGAYTGEVSAPMLCSLGCSYVIVGHSERRTLFNEKSSAINRKIRKCLEHGLFPILCIGETLEQKNEGITFEVLNKQIVYGLQGIDAAAVGRIVIAYEPIWAIGTGQSMAASGAEQSHRFIRSVVERFTNNEIARNVRIIYGGSVTPENAEELLKQDHIDGALIGGASLKTESFCEILDIAESLVRARVLS